MGNWKFSKKFDAVSLSIQYQKLVELIIASSSVQISQDTQDLTGRSQQQAKVLRKTADNTAHLGPFLFPRLSLHWNKIPIFGQKN